MNRPRRPAPEVVSSSDEDGDNGPSALLSAVPGGTSAAAPVDKGRTLHMVRMDCVHCPDAVMGSGMIADGSVAYAKATTTLYEYATTQESPVPDCRIGTKRHGGRDDGVSDAILGPVASYSFSRGFPETETQIWLLKK